VRLFTKTDIPKSKLFTPGGAEVVFKSSVGNFFREIDTEGTIIAVQETPVGVMGELADSIRFSRPTFLTAKIEWTAPYAQAVASGSRPHFAPIRRLSEWAAVKWGDYTAGTLLRDIIAERGTSANAYPKRTKKRVEQIARRLWPQKMSEFVRRILS
jgi:hypothetical protein